MTTRSFILAAGFVVAAIVCFFPPVREIENPLAHVSVLNPRTVEVTDYSRLFIRIAGVMCLTLAAWFIAATKRRVVVDATPKERSVVQ